MKNTTTVARVHAPRLAGERRLHRRLRQARAAALQHPHRDRVLTARTVDVSAGGCRLLLDAAPLIEPGEILLVAIATTLAHTDTAPDDFVPARVVRRVRRGIRQHIALAYITVRPLAAAG